MKELLLQDGFEYDEVAKKIKTKRGVEKVVGSSKGNKEDIIVPEMYLSASRMDKVGFPIGNWIDLLGFLLKRFYIYANSLRSRPGLKVFEIKNEYDLQFLVNALLKITFDDVRIEEPNPSSAGSYTKIDFLVKKEKIGVELKMTGEKIGCKEISKQLYNDIPHYRNSNRIKVLFILIYDPMNKIGNPVGFKEDLEKESNDKMKIFVIVSPHQEH